MNERTHDADPATEYQHCVAREREAWEAMHRLPPRTPARGQAFLAWSEALARTNAAWRRRLRLPRQAGGARPLQGHA